MATSRKITKDQDLETEVEILCHKPVVIGGLDAIPKNLGRHLENLQMDKIPICQLQKGYTTWIDKCAKLINYES